MDMRIRSLAICWMYVNTSLSTERFTEAETGVNCLLVRPLLFLDFFDGAWEGETTSLTSEVWGVKTIDFSFEDTATLLRNIEILKYLRKKALITQMMVCNYIRITYRIQYHSE